MIKLEPFKQADFDRLISWLDSEELLVQVAGPIFSYPLTDEQLIGYLQDNNRYAFKVVEASSDRVIGHAEIYRTEDDTAKICRVVIGDQSFRGMGIGQVLIGQLVTYAIERLKLITVELNVYDWNISAIKCYQKVGFVFNPEKFTTIDVNGHTWKSLNMVFKG